ncbi:hypothetical protein [Actinomadura mexicana]|uniref:Uncharacterized protein n=1 Tax=Actinomadura mexicana TaxID=134959 RepID=A0A238WQV4_9ACTN|nr:hypothetical protein [Actinomadura mexicana]SNR48936.1 hypothetical protein SAMN06265355_103180 [Actinomadura mexicana]
MIAAGSPEPDEATVRAVGKLSEALESIERARGHLYSWHQLTGKADFELGDAAALLAKAGHQGLADELSRELVGRNVLPDRWSFQAIEEYEDTYYEPLRRYEARVREALTAGRRHLYEAQLKEERRTHGHPHHTAAPGNA